ncbi:hypothetical protein FS837_000928 [Tulasnella sp. UAMH 9824]|nr:hypothetical protein FS837_000928 [Tulasnella sp. UAMH 9824]
MARDKTDQSALTPARNTRSQARLTQQGGSTQSSSQDSYGPAGDDTSFNMKITSDTFLLDLNESFAAHLMAGNSAGDATFAAPAPPSPKRRARGRRTPSPDKPPKAFNFGFRKPNEVASDTPAEPAEEALPQPTSSTQQPVVRNDKKPEAKAPSPTSQPFPVAAGPVETSGSNAEDGNALQSSSSNAPGATGADSVAKPAPRRRSLIARPASARIPLANSSAPSNAWLYRKSSQIMEPTPSTSSSPVGGEAENSVPKSSSAEPSNTSPSDEPQTTPSVSEPAAPAFRKIVKLKRTGLTRVSRSGNSEISDSQASSNEEPMRQPAAPVPTEKGADKALPTPTPSPPAPTSEAVSQPGIQPPKASTEADPHPVKEIPPVSSIVGTSDSPSVDLTESKAEPVPAPVAENDSETSREEVAFVEPPPRVAAHVPKPLPVVATKPKRARPATKDEAQPAKAGEAAQDSKEEGSKPKRIKTDHVAKRDPPKTAPNASTGVGRGLPSAGAVRPASKAASSTKAGRTFSAPTAASAKRVPLADRGQQRAVSNTTKSDKATKETTVPHAFTFESERRLDIKKAVQQAKERPAKVVLQTFKPAHHPATLDKPTAASLSRALATVSQSENQPPTGGKAPKKNSTLATHAKYQPTVPNAPKLATDERMKERSAFDEAIRKKEEERRKAEEAEQEAEERRKEQEVKELRKLLDETARANAHPVPEWYKERPKLKKETDGAGVSS